MFYNSHRGYGREGEEEEWERKKKNKRYFKVD